MTTLLEDKDAIRDVLHRYCFCMDEGQFGELAALFAEDGEWIAPYRTAKGPADIAAWLQQSVPSQPRRMHYVMNSIIQCEGAHATARSNYLVVVDGAKVRFLRSAAPTTTFWSNSRTAGAFGDGG